MKNSPENQPSAKAETKSASRRTGLKRNDTMAVAGAKVIRYHHRRLRKNESGARKGKNVEALHRMRVATRRLRAALRLFGPYLPAKQVENLEPLLKEARKTLGRVRDFDVLLQNLQEYMRKQSEEERSSLAPLMDCWTRDRAKARKRMIEYLDGSKYRRFQKACKKIREKGMKRDGKPKRKGKVKTKLLRHTVPRLVWGDFENVRTFETELENSPVDTYHALRIECKHLRYSLEFFEEILDPDVSLLIEEVVASQEHLGAVQDADVASRLLKSVLTKNRKEKLTPETIEAVGRYRQDFQSKQDRQIETFPEVWERLTGREFRRRLAVALALL